VDLLAGPGELTALGADYLSLPAPDGCNLP
jgi:hypothetical protein